jgi:hypothetical protein
MIVKCSVMLLAWKKKANLMMSNEPAFVSTKVIKAEFE